MKVFHQNCDPTLADDRSLPYNTYLVTYEIDGTIAYDLIQSSKSVEIFDYYWDRYREGLKGWKQSEGRVSPKLWGNQSPEEKKKKK